ncbi:MAG: TonB-dependent receptor [Hyphomicrobium sp.]
MKRVTLGCFSLAMSCAMCHPAWSQTTGPAAQDQAAPAAEGQEPLPDVEVIQKKQQPTPKPVAEPKPKVKKKAPVEVEAEAPAPKPKKVAAPKPLPETQGVAYVEPAEPASSATEAYANNPAYGAANSQGAAARATNSAQAPINGRNIAPANVETFSSAATVLDERQLEAAQPRQINDVFNRVPGVHVINDDGLGRHGGVGMRGSPPRRSRKIMTMEDGQSINMSTWFDPSVHYQPPVDRIESVEVVRGTSIVHGPNNNHGVVNYVNLSPFGPNESEISASIGSTSHRGGSEGQGDSPYGVSNARHVHTRQSIGNVGVVASYSGAEADGVWDLERLRYNDFYGAIGWRGVDQDLTLSAVYFRQRDNYDEANLTGEEGEDKPGDVEKRFFNGVGHAKSIFNPGSRFNTYSADVVKLQATHNYYLDSDTTITSKIYGFDHQRDRYQNVDGEDPSVADGRRAPIIDGEDIFMPEGIMLGRLRHYRQAGAEMRAEFANRPLAGTITQDIQIGARYEYNDFTNRNFFGSQGEILEYGDERGVTAFNTDTDANAFSTFLQTSINLTQDLKVIPGVRLEHYKISRLVTASTKEEGEAEACDPAENPFGAGEECVVLEGFDDTRISESFDKTHVLPGIAFSYSPINRTAFYGGYHRGLTMGVLREANARFPPGDELGDNYQIGVRTTAMRGVTFDIAAFHHDIQDFQIKGSTTDGSGNNVYGTLDKVEVNGFEVYTRVDGKAYTGGPVNLFVEGNYTLSDSKIRNAFGFVMDEDTGAIERVNLAGNYVPEVPTHVAHLTLGVQHDAGWDASLSWTYRGSFYTDEFNTPFGGNVEGEDGEVPDVWLLSARANLKLGNTGTSLFIAGDNLTDKLYISDREDGIKAGQGRTVWAGFKHKF